MKTFDFKEQLAVSDSPAVAAVVEPFLRRRFPGALSFRRASKENDRIGVDVFVEFPNAQHRSIDLKVRSTDYLARGRPDLALEVWSNKERGTPGWALDDNKVSDYILFVWTDTGRVLLVDARGLRAVVKANYRQLSADCQQADQRTQVGRDAYTSTVIFVSSRDLVAMLNRWQGFQDAA